MVYIREGHFLARLERLQLDWSLNTYQPLVEHGPFVDGPTQLLRHCANTLQELVLTTNLLNGDPIVTGVTNAGTF